jgi:hypothetical protein
LQFMIECQLREDERAIASMRLGPRMEPMEVAK